MAQDIVITFRVRSSAPKTAAPHLVPIYALTHNHPSSIFCPFKSGGEQILELVIYKIDLVCQEINEY